MDVDRRLKGTTFMPDAPILRGMMRVLPLLAALLLAGCGAPAPEPLPAPDPEGEGLRVEPHLRGFTSPLLVVDDPATEGEAYVVEQAGRVWRVAEGARDSEPFLDVVPLVRSGGEQGLLGLAFEPEGRPRRVYVSYTDTAGDSVLARYQIQGGRLDAASAEVLLQVDQPYANHNGGHVLFGPEGMLYYGLGDGGAGGDPHGNGQDPHALLGSLLRLDVRPAQGYAIPPDNPYADGERGAPEVWAKGLRNPWRFSFDRETGDLWLGDVGQNRVEEIDFLPAGSPGGANFGWNVFEGTGRFGIPGRSTFSEHVPPVAEYGHEDGCSVTGGHVYRGDAMPALRGVYLFGDYCSGILWGLRNVNGTWAMAKLLDTDHRVSSFAEDERGEPLLVDHAGSVHRLAAGPGELPPALRAP